jgi:hypothetical protein
MLVLTIGWLFWPPAGHDVRPPGALAIAGVQVSRDGQRLYLNVPTLSPNMSLLELRCEAWELAIKIVCPDAATLSRWLWPEIQQTSKTLYVGISTDCFQYNFLSDFNVEYQSTNRRLTIHCYRASPWITWFTPASCRKDCVPGGPLTAIFVVPIDAITPGPLTVIRDDRIEHSLGDQSVEATVGTLTVS